jgi:excinuclease ABC subunit A
VVEHAREHNLRDVSTSIPHGALVVVTGPSGSGKSTLAFDVVFAEGQRRFLETLTPYARQFLPTLPRPSVDRVTGVPPSVALEQRRSRAGLASTVSTVTEAGHYLRLLFAKVGTPHCPDCEVPIEPRPRAAILEALRKKRRGALLVPVVNARKGTHADVFGAAARDGVQRARVDGAVVPTSPPPKLAKTREHTIELVLREGSLASLDEATLARALEQGGGAVRHTRDLGAEPGELYSTTRACPRCGKGVPELDPRFFSFNTKQGQCATCEGSGYAEGDDDEPLEQRSPCGACAGARLSPLPRSVRLGGARLHEIERRPLDEALAFVRDLAFAGDAARIAEAPLAELVRRLEFARSVGLSYLSLDRRAATLSGGEMQRLRLSAQLGSGLTGALYVLDEPTIGLHPRDTTRLLDNLRALVDMGSTVLLVEHDSDTIRAADHVIDLGPGGGASGGRIVAEGPAREVLASPLSPTGRALREEASASSLRRASPAPRGHEHLVLRGAREHNLRVRELSLPVGRLNVVAGVSGSGKSTLVRRVLLPAAQRALGLDGASPGFTTSSCCRAR